MEQEKAVKLIDDIGRIVLPTEVRQAMDWGEKTPVEIWLNATDDEVVIKRHKIACVFCGATENLRQYRKKPVCSSCQSNLVYL